jgi:hypothetical protein
MIFFDLYSTDTVGYTQPHKHGTDMSVMAG